jgi:serine/threonine protein kinase
MPFLVMRYMGGGALSDRLRRGPLSAREAAQVLARLAPALDLAHTRGVVHRDLKPANILFDDNGEPHISDFGIAKLTNSQQQTELTRGMIVGTPHYMSPEQARGEPLDGRSDLYALGAIVFEMLTGKLPFDAENPTGVMMKHIIDPVPELARVQPNLAADWQRVVDTALAKKREERFQTAGAMADAVTATAHGRAPVNIDPGKTLVWPGEGGAAPVAVPSPGAPAAPVPMPSAGPAAQVMPRVKPLTVPAPTPMQKRSGGTALALLAFALVGIACLLIAGFLLLRGGFGP